MKVIKESKIKNKKKSRFFLNSFNVDQIEVFQICFESF